MNRNDTWQLEVGDWVKGRSMNGELIHGYIENVDRFHGIVKVTVVECDNEKTIGKTIGTPNKWVEKMPVASFKFEEQILDLIDMALSTKDELWFMELTANLNAFRKGLDGSNKKMASYSHRNRLGTYGLKLDN